MLNSIYLHKDDLETILQFLKAFPNGTDIVEVTSDNSSGIGSIITAKISGIALNGTVVDVTKTIVDESSW
jgi:predicted RNase H-like nuclease (RuvC/YqgF family)